MLNTLVHDVDDLAERACAIADTTGTARARVSKVGGGHIEVEWDERNFREVYRDEYTGEVLPPELIRAAIKDELSYFNAHVWEVTDKEGMKAFKDAKLVRCRWVLSNKGDT